MDIQYLKHRIKRKEMYLHWLHQQAMSGLPWEVVTEILESKAVNYIQKKSYELSLEELTRQSVDIEKKGENDGINDHFNS
jgi:hypothetical protein